MPAPLSARDNLRTKTMARFIPINHPLSFEVIDRADSQRLVVALQERLKEPGRSAPQLNKRDDGEFLKGAALFFGLRYAHDLMELVNKSLHVEIRIEEVPD